MLRGWKSLANGRNELAEQTKNSCQNKESPRKQEEYWEWLRPQK